MRKTLITVFFILLLCSCKPNEYDVAAEIKVDGYLIYEKQSKGLFCNTYYEDIYYSGKDYNYGFKFKSCSADMTHFIKVGTEYVYLKDALHQELITLDSLLPLLTKLERNPEDISSEEADYVWLDFHIGNRVVYAYAGGECDQIESETFIINGVSYTYQANGCLKANILFMRIDGKNVPLATLIENGTVDGEYLVPLLIETE